MEIASFNKTNIHNKQCNVRESGDRLSSYPAENKAQMQKKNRILHAYKTTS
jgi:hypothetical protein